MLDNTECKHTSTLYTFDADGQPEVVVQGKEYTGLSQNRSQILICCRPSTIIFRKNKKHTSLLLFFKDFVFLAKIHIEICKMTSFIIFSLYHFAISVSFLLRRMKTD